MHRTPEFITFTGIDDRTDLTRASKIAERYPIEWGVLISAKNRDARYPCKQAIMEILDISGKKSAHLCGEAARNASELIIPDYLPLKRFQRAQLNGVIKTNKLTKLTEEFGVDVIFQEQGSTFDTNKNYFQLFDRSGGEGIIPETIPQLGGQGALVGYAGGMGPETVMSYLEKIKGEGEFWIDMEGRIRTEGWFDMDKVQRVCELVYRHH